MITKPTFILDEQKCKRNIEFMVQKARNRHVEFRPHVKTHQSLEIGRWFKAAGVRKITVSSLDMALYFSAEWDDITVAFPVNILEIATINTLAQKITLNLLVESVEAAFFLAQNVTHNVGCYLKIDVGYHRTGIQPENTETIESILRIIKASDKLSFEGFLTHAGHTYTCRSKAEIQAIYSESVRILKTLKKRYFNDFPEANLSVGDTPGCSVVNDFEGVDEIRPGNFVFYDVMQFYIGSCSFSEIAVALACPVVAVHKHRNEVVVHGGAIHFSKESVNTSGGVEIFGQVVAHDENGWSGPMEGMVLQKMSQEHGIVSVPEKTIQKIAVGDVVYIVPVHSCLTANQMKTYQALDGKTITTIHGC